MSSRVLLVMIMATYGVALLDDPGLFVVLFFVTSCFGAWLLVRAVLRYLRAASGLRRFGAMTAIVAIVAASMLYGAWESHRRAPRDAASGDGSAPVPSADALERLEALGYLPYVVENTAPRKTGVVRHDPARSNPGFNLYNSYYQTGAYLLDNSGTPLHSWAPADTRPHWQYVTLYDDDSLLVSIEQKMLQRVAWDSRIIWQARIRTHHDVTVDGNGDIYTLASEDEMVFFRGFPVPIVNDHITVLSPDGTVTKQVSLFAALEERIPSNRIWKAYRRIIRPKNVWKTLKRRVKGWRQVLGHRFEVLHTNSLVILDTDVEGLGRKGDALISVKHLDLVGIVDLETGRLTWSWGPGKVDRQHHATVVDGGNILVFDNGTRRGYSRVVEIDPLTRRVTWEYRADPPSAFYSSWGGAAQRLPNGNTLITDTASGRAFEVTRDGEIVWEFFNPQRHKRRRATIYRLQRIVNAGGRARLRELEERI